MKKKDIEQINRNNTLDLRGDETDRTGVWYGRLQAIRQTNKPKKGLYNWLCLCVCLGTREVSGEALDLGEVADCGCISDIEEDDEEELPGEPSPHRPLWLTQGQMDLLMLTAPVPFGQGLKIKVAAKKLKISSAAAYLRMRRFKQRFPSGAQRLTDLCSARNVHREGLKYTNVKSLETLIEKHGLDTVETFIVVKNAEHRF